MCLYFILSGTCPGVRVHAFPAIRPYIFKPSDGIPGQITAQHRRISFPCGRTRTKVLQT